MSKAANTDGQISTASVKIDGMKTANNDGQISSVSGTIVGDPVRAPVKKQIDVLLRQQDRRAVIRSFVKYLDEWIAGQVNDQEICYFKNNLNVHELALLTLHIHKLAPPLPRSGDPGWAEFENSERSSEKETK